MEAATSIFRQDGPYFANDFIDTLVEAFGVPRKLRKLLRSKTLCKDSIVFWGVNFCREGLWEKGRGEWHEIKQILCKDSIVFLEVILCHAPSTLCESQHRATNMHDQIFPMQDQPR